MINSRRAFICKWECVCVWVCVGCWQREIKMIYCIGLRVCLKCECLNAQRSWDCLSGGLCLSCCQCLSACLTACFFTCLTACLTACSPHGRSITTWPDFLYCNSDLCSHKWQFHLTNWPCVYVMFYFCDKTIEIFLIMLSKTPARWLSYVSYTAVSV